MVKKLVGALLAPVTAGMIFLVVAFLLSLTTRFRRAGRVALGVGLVVAWLLGTAPVADALLGPLESRYPAVHDPRFSGSDLEWILVLGHGHSSDSRYPAPARLNDEALFRLTEGVRLLGLLPGATLVVSGGGSGRVSQAQALRDAAVAMGVDPARIRLEDTAMDTGEEADRMARFLGDHDDVRTPILLVTSAAHMPRAVRHFTNRGMDPIPAPAQAYVQHERGRDFRNFVPTASSYRKVERAVHEYLGMAWVRLAPGR